MQSKPSPDFNPIEEARTNYLVYASLVNSRYDLPPHVDIMGQALEMMERGEIDRLMVSCPPRHSKSETITKTYPAWFLGRHPEQKVIIAANTQPLAAQFGATIRNKMMSPMHQAIFPECQLSTDTKAKDEFTTTAGGEFYACGVGGTLPGRGFFLGVVDDAFKGWKEAQSKVQRQTIHDWYQGVFYNRQEPNAKIIVINTRWHCDDLTGWLLDPDSQDEIDNWFVLNFPAIAECDEGWRKEGEELWKERWPLRKLERIKRATKSQQIWQAVYQGAPSAIEGIEIKKSWFKYYHWDSSLLTREDFGRMNAAPFEITLSIDTAQKTEDANDYSVIEVWLSTASGEYLLDVVRKKMLMPELYRCVRETALYYRPDAILIEDTSAGTSLMQMLRASTKLPIIGYTPHGDKQMRMRAVSYMWESGRIFHPFQKPWLSEFESELVAFPTAAHDDQCDAASQYLSWRKNKDYAEEVTGGDIEDMGEASLFEDFEIAL